jgi:hypothetical protein
MPVVGYIWPEDTRCSIGFTAESVNKVMPNVVIKDNNDLAILYATGELTAILWGAVRELARRIDAIPAKQLLTP